MGFLTWIKPVNKPGVKNLTLTSEQISTIVELKAEGQSNRAVAEKARCSVSSVKKYYQKHQKKQLDGSHYIPTGEIKTTKKTHRVKHLSTADIRMEMFLDEDGFLLDENSDFTLEDWLDDRFGVEEQVRTLLSKSRCSSCDSEMAMLFYCERCRKMHTKKVPYAYFDNYDMS